MLLQEEAATFVRCAVDRKQNLDMPINPGRERERASWQNYQAFLTQQAGDFVLGVWSWLGSDQMTMLALRAQPACSRTNPCSALFSSTGQANYVRRFGCGISAAKAQTYEAGPERGWSSGTTWERVLRYPGGQVELPYATTSTKAY